MELYGNFLINARCDTYMNKSIYEHFKHCTVIVSGYYEWFQKKPYVLKPPTNYLYIAALMNEDGVILLTQNSFGELERIHDRTPLVLVD